MWEPIFNLVFTTHISINIRRPTIIFLDLLLVLAIGFPNYFRIIFMLVFWSFYKGIHPVWHAFINKPSPAVLDMYTLMMHIFVVNPVCSFCAIWIYVCPSLCVFLLFEEKYILYRRKLWCELQMVPFSSLVCNNIDVIQSSYNKF